MTIEEIERLEHGKKILKRINDAKEFDTIVSHLLSENTEDVNEFKIVFRINKTNKNEKFEIVAANRYLDSKLYVDESDFRFIINTIRHMLSDRIESDNNFFKIL